MPYFKTIQCYSHSRYLRGFKSVKTWKNNQKTDFSAASARDEDISIFLIWFTYTKNKVGMSNVHYINT